MNLKPQQPKVSRAEFPQEISIWKTTLSVVFLNISAALSFVQIYRILSQLFLDARVENSMPTCGATDSDLFATMPRSERLRKRERDRESAYRYSF